MPLLFQTTKEKETPNPKLSSVGLGRTNIARNLNADASVLAAILGLDLMSLKAPFSSEYFIFYDVVSSLKLYISKNPLHFLGFPSEKS